MKFPAGKADYQAILRGQPAGQWELGLWPCLQAVLLQLVDGFNLQ
jgi:hypothetical protein